MLENKNNSFGEELLGKNGSVIYNELINKPTIIGEKIKQLRKEKFWTQRDLAKKLNVANSTLSQYESGFRVPSDEIKILLADLFDVSLDYLFGRCFEKNNINLNTGPQNSKEELLIKNFRLLLSEQQDIITAQMVPFIEMNKKGETNELLNSISKKNA